MDSYAHPNNSWLPPDVAAQAEREEPRRFHAVVEEVQAAWKRGKEQGHGGETLKWVSVVNSFVASKTRLEIADLQLVSETALDIITSYRGPRDLFTQIRWSQCVSRILRKHRSSLSLSIPWQPLYSILVIHLPSAPGSTPLRGYVGAALLQIHINAITELIRRSRRFFPPGSAADIWAFLRPQFADVSSNDALEAAALLNLFLPTTCRHLAPYEEDASSQWSVWVPEWLSLWFSIPQCTFWDAQWLSILSRLAKHQQLRHQHQTTSSSPPPPPSPSLPSSSSPSPNPLSLWAPHLPFLFQKILDSFSLPIGQSPSATSAQLERPVSPACARVFLSLLDRWQQRRAPFQQQVVRAVAGAKLAVWLLANPEPPAAGSDAEPVSLGSDGVAEKQGGEASVLRMFDKVSNDLEQFFHPSNGGEWTGLLEKMLHSATYHLVKRIAAEKKIHGDRYLSGPTSALSRATTSAFIRLLLRLIHNRALFSKSPNLSAVASRVAASLSYLAPRVTLPVVLESFQGALTTVTATHQLESALSTLALSVRPLLLAAGQTTQADDPSTTARTAAPYSMEVDGAGGEGAGEGSGEGMDTWQEMIGRAREVVSEAMVATLPGIDANDPPKTLATLHLYLSVFSSIGPIGDDSSPFSLSIDWSTWLEDFLSRLFSLFSHLESAAPTATVATAAAANERSFLMKEAEGSTFRSTVSLLFARLSPPLLNQVISRVERYVSSTVVRGCEEEIGTVVAALAYAAPEATCNRILAGVMDSALSLLQSLPATSFLALAESPAAAAAAEGEALKLPANQLSTTQEATVLFHMHLASNAVPFSGSALIAHKDRLTALINAAFSSTSQKVVDAAADLLQKFLFALIFFYPLNEYTFLGWEESAAGVERWVSKQAAAATTQGTAGPLQWHVPSAEETALATQLIDNYLGGALRDLRWLLTRPATSASSSSAATGAKLAWRVALRRLWAVFSGTRTNLPDLTTRFGSQASGLASDTTGPDTPLAVVGRSGVSVGDVAVREEAAGVLHEACVWLVRQQRDDTQTLALLAEVEGLLLNPGTLEYSDSLHGLRVVKQQAGLLSEPKGSPWMKAGETRRRPPWVLAELAYEHLLWRASQAHFKTIYAGQRRPPPLSRAVKIVLGDLLLLSVHRYASVQGVARASLELILKRFPPAVGTALAQLAPCVAGEAGAVTRLRRMGEGSDSNGDKENGNEGDMEEKEDREEAAVGACQVFMSRPIMRKIAQDWRSLAPFLSALLASQAIDSLKAQNSITQVFIAFVSRFAGVNPIRPRGWGAPGMEQEQAGSEENGWELSGANNGAGGDITTQAQGALTLLWTMAGAPGTAAASPAGSGATAGGFPVVDGASTAAAAISAVAAAAAGVGAVSGQASASSQAVAASAAVAAAATHWRYTLMANALLALLSSSLPSASPPLPPSHPASPPRPSSVVSSSLPQLQPSYLPPHYLSLIAGPLPLLRPLATSALLLLLPPSLQSPPLSPVLQSLTLSSPPPSSSLPTSTSPPLSSSLTPSPPLPLALLTSPSFLSSLTLHLSLDHSTGDLPSSIGGGGRGRGGGLGGLFGGGGGGKGAGGGDNPGATVSALFTAGLAASSTSALLSDWPRSKLRGLVPSSPQVSSFVVGNAMLFELLVHAAAAAAGAAAAAAAAAPGAAAAAAAEADDATASANTAVTAFLHALYPSLKDLVSKETDRGAQSAAAEIIAGILASAHPAVLHAWQVKAEAKAEGRPEGEAALLSGDSSANSPPPPGWLARLFHQALLHCSVESQPDWATCVRYALTRRQAVRRKDSESGEAEGGGDVGGEGSEEGGGEVRARIQQLVREKLLEKLPGNAASGQQAKRLTLLVVAIGEMGQGREMDQRRGGEWEGGEKGTAEEEERFLDRLVEEVNVLMAHSARQVRQLLGEVLSALLAALNSRSSLSSTVAASLSNHILAEAAKAVTVIKSMGSGSDQQKQTKEGEKEEQVHEEEKGGMEVEEGGGEGSSAAGREGTEEDRCIWTMESILFFVMSAVKSGDAPPFLPTIVALLPALLSIQETPNTDLSLLAKQCLAYTKYLPLPASAVPSAAAAVLAATDSGNWKERAAALSFCQSFVFRNGFLLPATDLAALRQAVVACLQDPQPEVRDMASATLAGLLKAAPQGDTWPSAIRQSFIQSAASTLKASRAARRRANQGRPVDADSAAKAAARTVKMHGSALGLAAAVRSAPYDIPTWLPELLLALANLAGEPPPVGPAVGKALGDFKRTHADSWHIHKEAFTSEQLEVINDLSSTVGYFV
ncbi:hypothetical protein CLOM_g22765 [Closterium sp. NIES-68]|nr:hypothetical protein CLOM_g22765 [Closterium sp. NIES-68]